MYMIRDTQKSKMRLTTSQKTFSKHASVSPEAGRNLISFLPNHKSNIFARNEETNATKQFTVEKKKLNMLEKNFSAPK